MLSKNLYKSQSSTSILTIVLCIILGSIISFSLFYSHQQHNLPYIRSKNDIYTSISRKSPPPLGSIRVNETRNLSSYGPKYGGQGDKQHLGGWIGKPLISLINHD